MAHTAIAIHTSRKDGPLHRFSLSVAVDVNSDVYWSLVILSPLVKFGDFRLIHFFQLFIKAHGIVCVNWFRKSLLLLSTFTYLVGILNSFFFIVSKKYVKSNRYK